MGCTHADYLRVKALGEAAVRKLGADWVVETWDNLGWHVTVNSGAYVVHIRTEKRKGRKDRQHYWVDFMAGGHQYTAEGLCPVEAVRCVSLGAIKSATDTLNAIIQEIL